MKRLRGVSRSRPPEVKTATGSAQAAELLAGGLAAKVPCDTRTRPKVTSWRRVKVELLESPHRGAGRRGPRAQRTAQGDAGAASSRRFRDAGRHARPVPAGYVMEDCSEYRGKPENLAATSANASTSSQRAPRRAPRPLVRRARRPPRAARAARSTRPPVRWRSRARRLNATARSPRSTAVTAQNISPPLEWQNVPAKAAALVLFIIDATASGPASGIRWVVGDISPSAKGVAAGQDSGRWDRRLRHAGNTAATAGSVPGAGRPAMSSSCSTR